MIDTLLEKHLGSAEFIVLSYHLRFEEDLSLPAFGLLRLRREFSRLLPDCLPANLTAESVRQLLKPLLPVDPGLLRRVQQPAPGFVFLIENTAAHNFTAGESLVLKVFYFGRGTLLVETLSTLLETLGAIGLCGRSGRFKLKLITNADSLEEECLWSGGAFKLVPQIYDLSQRLELLPGLFSKLEFCTPARLLKNSRPMFRPSFAEIFPFILRRVTGMLAAWANLEDLFDIHFLLDQSRHILESDNQLKWQDWRPLDGRDAAGGVSGSVVLSGAALANIWPILKLGELFGIGKGAAFGAGQYRLG